MMTEDQEIYDPRDADKEEFNVDMYMLDIIENCSLPNLVSKKNIADKETRELSSDIQNMVYENYSKFISASQVVSNISSNFNKMVQDMDLLQTKMRQLEDTSSHILNNLQPSKDGIVKWSKSRECVHKLISLIDLVPRLKKLIEGGDYSSAAHHYSKAQYVLKQNRHLKSLRGIIEDSEEIVSIIKLNMKEKLNCEKYESGDIFETMKLLLELGEDSKTILKNFLLVTTNNVNNILETFEIRPQLFSENADQNLASAVKLSDYCSLSCKYLDTLYKTIDIAQRFFVKTNMNNSPILENFVIEHTEVLHEEMRRKFKEHSNELEDEYLANILDQFYRKCHKCYMHINKTALSSRNVDFLLYICIDRCSFKFCRMREQFEAHLQTLERRLSEKFIRLNDSLTSLNTMVEHLFLSTLSSLCPYINPENRYSRNVCFRKQFCKTIVHEGVFISFIKHMNNAILRKDPNLKTRRQMTPCLSILLTKFTLEMSAYRVQDLLSKVNENLYSSEENIKLTSIPEIANECRVTAKKMLHSYVNVRQAKVSAMLKNSFDNKDWMNMKEPWKVSAVIRRALEDFEEALREIEPLFVSFSTRVSSRDSNLEKTVSFNAFSRTSSPDRNSLDGILTNRIYQLFSRSPVYLDTVKFASESILGCIVKLTLKSLLECVRHRTFNQYGLQQMQVDVHCLEVWVLRYLKNGKDFILLFDDIISSCYSRTLQPEFMNLRVVSAICQTF